MMIVSVLQGAWAQTENVAIGDTHFAVVPLTVPGGEKAFAAADVDGDGHADLIATAEDGLTVFLGDGRGGLERRARHPSGPDPTHVTAADLDSDGDVDLVIANHETTQLTMLLGDGKGGFHPADNSPLEIAVDPHPHVVAAEDLDADGRLDLIVDHRNGEGLLVIYGLGDGEFGEGRLIATGGDPYLGMAIGDVDGDGRPDLITPNPNSVGIALNKSARRYEGPRLITAPRPFAVALADLSADGHADLIVASSGGITVLAGDGRGAFEPFGTRVAMAAGAKAIATGDFNGDRIDDALIIGWPGDAHIVFGGEASFDAEALTLPGIDHPWGLAVADFDQDGIDDFVVADGERPVARLFSSATKQSNSPPASPKRQP